RTLFLGGVLSVLKDRRRSCTLRAVSEQADSSRRDRDEPGKASGPGAGPVLLSERERSRLWPARPGQSDGLYALRQAATPPAVLQDVQGPLLRAQRDAAVRRPAARGP